MSEILEVSDWDAVRRSQVAVIVAASQHVEAAMYACGQTYREVERLKSQLATAEANYTKAVEQRDAASEKVREFVEEYQHIGKTPPTTPADMTPAESPTESEHTS